jgi:hypothetical protein
LSLQKKQKKIAFGNFVCHECLCSRNRTGDSTMTKLKNVAVACAILTTGGWGQFQAATIQIDLGSPATYEGSNTQLGPIPFLDLDGTPVNGASLSLDFLFTNSEFVRLFHQTTTFFEVQVTLLTSAGTAPGFVTSASGDLIDENGTAIPGFSVVGTADSSNGSTTLGFFPLLEDINGTPDPNIIFPLDFYGVHFGFTLPDDPSVDVISGQFTLNGAGQNSRFAVGPPVPDNGNTLELLTFATLLLIMYGRAKIYRSKRHRWAASTLP